MPKTYNDIFMKVRKRLKDADIAGYSLEARLLVSAAAAKTKEEFTRDMSLYVNQGFEERVDALLVRRLQGEPLAYITGAWEFYGIPINVTREVLIPRVDTEVLAAQAISRAKWLSAGSRVLDLCCGSGCVGIAVARNVPQVKVVLADLSPDAVKISRSNVVLNKLTSRVTCTIADARKAPLAMLGEFDMILCNPPYIPSRDIDKLERSVKSYEPRLALDGGDDGLDFYRLITMEWRKILKPGGSFMYECGIGQAKNVEYILRTTGFEKVSAVQDTLGIDRVVIGEPAARGEKEN